MSSFEQPNDFESMDNFYREMKRLKKEEEENGETAHFESLDVSELQDADREVWERFKEKQLTPGEFEEYREEIGEDETSRRHFAAFLANKLQIQVMEEQMKETGNYREDFE